MALPDTANLYMEYFMNESSGTNVPDTSGNTRDATCVNMDNSDWVAAKILNGLQLDGVNDEIQCSTYVQFDNTDSFSIETWLAKEAGIPTNSGVFSNLTGAYLGIKVMLISSSRLIRFHIGTDSTNYAYTDTGVQINDTNFHHVVCTYDGSKAASGMTTYVDGSAVGTSTGKDVWGASAVSTATNRIGETTSANQNFKGTFDIFRIWSAELTSGEVSSLWNGGTGIESLTPAGATFPRRPAGRAPYIIGSSTRRS